MYELCYKLNLISKLKISNIILVIFMVKNSDVYIFFMIL